MLDGNDTNTFHSLRLLDEVVRESKKPLLFWIGAGASVWCGFPLWNQLAGEVHSKFLKSESKYNKHQALVLIKAREFPQFFQYCKDINQQKYFSVLMSLLNVKPVTPVYLRFLEIIQSILPCYIVTTNVDETLENSLTGITVVQRSDLERCIDLLQEEQSFVCKLHGSTSSVESMVFTNDDYNSLLADEHYLKLIEHIFAQTSIIFIGYGLGDKYLVDSLLKVERLKHIFGNGPHFAIVATTTEIPDFIKPIRYVTTTHKDHRSAIQVIEEIRIAKDLPTINSAFGYVTAPPIKTLKSAHLISDIYPPSNSTTLTLNDGSFLITGDGMSEKEVPLTGSTAMHDLIVGLLCFEIVYIPWTALQRVHILIGSDLFWELVKTDSIKFIYWTRHEFIHCSPISSDNGLLASGYLIDAPISKQIKDFIRNSLKVIPGKELEAGELFNLLENKFEIITNETEPEVSSLTKGILLRQSIRNLIGMSGGTHHTSIPPWMIYPVLRLSNVVKIGTACHLLGIASTKLEFGSAELAGPAFAASLGNEWADNMASYILTGRFDTDLGSVALQDHGILIAIMKFRESVDGATFRREVFEQLSVRHGADFAASVNAGMAQAIPTKHLQNARDQLAGLLIAERSLSELTPAIWNNYQYSNNALNLWKKYSLKQLNEYCNNKNITSYDQCPCNSGEKLKFCCEESLVKNIKK